VVDRRESVLGDLASGNEREPEVLDHEPGREGSEPDHDQRDGRSDGQERRKAERGPVPLEPVPKWCLVRHEIGHAITVVALRCRRSQTSRRLRSAVRGVQHVGPAVSF